MADMSNRIAFADEILPIRSDKQNVIEPGNDIISEWLRFLAQVSTIS
jgi:hypothetical protein